MNFTVMQTECFSQLGLDSTDSTNQTNVQRWLNMIQQDMAGRWPWNWLRGREAIPTVIDLTGLAGVTNGNANITDLNFQIGASHVGRFIQFTGQNDWYEIAGFGAPNFPSLAVAYQGTTSASVTYTVRKIFYSLSSSADRIVDIRNFNTPLKLIEVDPRTLDDRRPNPQSTATSSAFIAYGYDSIGNIRISPYPFPNDARLLEFRTMVRVSDLTGSQTSVIPAKWHHVMIFGALALGFAYLRKFEASGFWNGEYEKKIGDMLKQERTSEDEQPVLKAVDSVARGNFVRLPDQYPAIGPGGA